MEKKSILFVKFFCLTALLSAVSLEVFAQVDRVAPITYIRIGVTHFQLGSSGPILTASEQKNVEIRAEEACKKIGDFSVASVGYLSADNEEVPKSLYQDFLRENVYRRFPENRFWVVKVQCERESLLLSEPLFELRFEIPVTI